MAALAALPEAYPRIGQAIIGFSGGLDSTALLLAATRSLSPAWEVSAIHVHHDLQPQADGWADHCRDVCRRLGVPHECLRVQVADTGDEGREAAARRARYAALGERLGPDSALLVAHHFDDQVETLLIQLLRGCGPRGLAAMPAARPLGQGLLLRPWLGVRRDALQVLVAAAGLTWIEDPMNEDSRLERAFVRRRLLPLLEQRRPGVAAALHRTATLCGDAGQVLDELLEDRVAGMTDAAGGLDLVALRACSRLVRREVLRTWLRRLALPLPQARQLDQLLEQLDARPDARVCVTWPGVEVRRYRQTAWAMVPLAFPQPDGDIIFDRRELVLPAGIGRLRWDGSGRWPTLTVRFRTGGERIRLPGAAGTQSVKKLCQEQGIPPWERARLPLLYAGDELVAVADLWHSRRWLELLQDTDLRLRFDRQPLVDANGAIG